MPTHQESEMDDAILAVAGEQWQKVAMIIGRVVHDGNKLPAEQDYDFIAARIVALVECGKLESQGDLSRWRFSEVRLRQEESASRAAAPRERGWTVFDSIRSMQEALEEEPESLPHLRCMARLLMETESWDDANAVLDEVILLSESKGEGDFVDDARLRKIICLRALGRDEEIGILKAKLAPGTKVFIGSRNYGIDDLDDFGWRRYT
jgi:Protein of unknown function